MNKKTNIIIGATMVLTMAAIITPMIAGATSASELQGRIEALKSQLQTLNGSTSPSNSDSHSTETTRSTTTTSTDITAKIACVGTAVNTRETAIVSAQASFTASANTAYTTRASALQAAYALTTADAVKPAVRKAWSDFTASVKTGRMDWQKSRLAAWNAFRASVKTCKAPASVSDSANAAVESSGL